MKLLIVPNFREIYDQNMTAELGKAFTAQGVNNAVITSPINDVFLNKLVKEEKFDCIFRINRFRPHSLDKNVSNFWFQDFDLINVDQINVSKSDDIIYSTGTLDRLGIKKILRLKIKFYQLVLVEIMMILKLKNLVKILI